MQSNTKNHTQLDSYSLLITSKYFKNQQDYINVICVCKKFKETTEKLRFNPISIKSLKLFPKIQTQYLYNKDDIKLSGIDNYEILYEISYDKYLKYNINNNIKYNNVVYTHSNRMKFGDTIPKKITILGGYCFGNEDIYAYDASNIIEITIPSVVKTIRNRCFYYCESVTSINLSSTVTSLGNECFNSCTSLKSITLPFTITSLKTNCFYNCSSLQSIDLPSTLKFLGYGCFGGCTSLISIKIPSLITSLGNFVFSNCYSLKSINLPSTIALLGINCFFNCTSLTTITLPSTLTSLGDMCFFGCLSLQSINGAEK